MILAIKSPKATKVKWIHAVSGAKVESGDLLIELEDFEEAKVLAEIRRAIEENRAKADEVAGPVVAEKLAGLGSIHEQRLVVVEASRTAYAATQDERTVGQATILDVIKARQDVSLRSYQALQASVELEIFRRNADDAGRVYKVVDALLKKELEYVEGSAARLRIAAPRGGTFTGFVFAGTPVRRGHLLAEIE